MRPGGEPARGAAPRGHAPAQGPAPGRSRRAAGAACRSGIDGRRRFGLQMPRPPLDGPPDGATPCGLRSESCGVLLRMRNAEEEADDGRVRLDKWLWAARFFKTRSLAAEAIAGGKVQVNGDRAKRARPVQVGDRIRVRLGPYENDEVVRDLSSRRGPATAAAGLYEETSESLAARETLAVQLKSLHLAFGPDRGRPTKRDRREIERFRGKR